MAVYEIEMVLWNGTSSATLTVEIELDGFANHPIDAINAGLSAAKEFVSTNIEVSINGCRKIKSI